MGVFTTAKTAIKFEPGTYTLNGREVSFPAFELKTAIIRVARTKKIIQTEIAGKDNPVLEFISNGAFDIQIVGVLTGDNGVAPTDEFETLIKILDAPMPLDITCPWLQLQGIHQIVILSDDRPQEAGGQSYQNFSISAASDVPVNLRISGV